jgi:hypothetical protein
MFWEQFAEFVKAYGLWRPRHLTPLQEEQEAEFFRAYPWLISKRRFYQCLGYPSYT